MPLLPEQLQALAYVRTRGTDASLDSIRRRVAETYSDFEALVEAIPADIARESSDPSGWCVQEVVDHLIESERPAVSQLALLLAGQNVAESIPASLQSAKPLEVEWQAVIASFRALHGSVLDLLASASDALPLTATAPVYMVVPSTAPDGTLIPVSWIEHFDWKAYSIILHAHNRQHIAQIHRILKSREGTF